MPQALEAPHLHAIDLVPPHALAPLAELAAEDGEPAFGRGLGRLAVADAQDEQQVGHLALEEALCEGEGAVAVGGGHHELRGRRDLGLLHYRDVADDREDLPREVGAPGGEGRVGHEGEGLELRGLPVEHARRLRVPRDLPAQLPGHVGIDAQIARQRAATSDEREEPLGSGRRPPPAHRALELMAHQPEQDADVGVRSAIGVGRRALGDVGARGLAHGGVQGVLKHVHVVREDQVALRQRVARAFGSAADQGRVADGAGAESLAGEWADRSSPLAALGVRRAARAFLRAADAVVAAARAAQRLQARQGRGQVVPGQRLPAEPGVLLLPALLRVMDALDGRAALAGRLLGQPGQQLLGEQPLGDRRVPDGQDDERILVQIAARIVRRVGQHPGDARAAVGVEPRLGDELLAGLDAPQAELARQLADEPRLVEGPHVGQRAVQPTHDLLEALLETLDASVQERVRGQEPLDALRRVGRRRESQQGAERQPQCPHVEFSFLSHSIPLPPAHSSGGGRGRASAKALDLRRLDRRGWPGLGRQLEVVHIHDLRPAERPEA